MQEVIDEVELAFAVNGDPVRLKTTPHATLLEVLREQLELTGTKCGCGEGECGACTVLLNGEPVVSCLLAAGQVPDGAEITTAGIHVPSAVRCEALMTIPKVLIVRTLGRLSNAAVAAVNDCLRDALAL